MNNKFENMELQDDELLDFNAEEDKEFLNNKQEDAGTVNSKEVNKKTIILKVQIIPDRKT